MISILFIVIGIADKIRMLVTLKKILLLFPRKHRTYNSSFYVVKKNSVYFFSRDKEIIQNCMWDKIGETMNINEVNNIAMIYDGYY